MAMRVLSGSIIADPGNLRESRAQVSSWLSGQASQAILDDIIVVFSELLTNGVTASGRGESVDFRVELDANQIRVTVANGRGDASQVKVQPMPQPEAEGGRGLALAQVYSDRLEILLALDSVEVTATFVL